MLAVVVLLAASGYVPVYNPAPANPALPPSPTTDGSGQLPVPAVTELEPLADRTWIEPGKIWIGNYIYAHGCGYEMVRPEPMALSAYPCPQCGVLITIAESDWKDERFYPGERAEQLLTIHNGKEEACQFRVEYSAPRTVHEGYVVAPYAVQDWVSITEKNPILGPRETRQILIILAMPGDAEMLAPKWEFWISVMDVSQAGNVKTKLSSRWMVSMRV